MGFEHLHPAIQHHIVNSLGWTSLRPMQKEAVKPILAGSDVLIVGPTAGGKTEAAALPLLSRMANEEWSGLTTIYVAPLRALANDIEQRLQELFGFAGRTVAAWHGDVGQSRRREILREPPDLLVTTPESLEVMLTSKQVDHRRLFSQLEAIVVDEIHAFGGDDRGWHLLAVLARIERLRDKRLQRVGLSATVGNPGPLLDWLRMTAEDEQVAEGVVVQPETGARRDPDLRADYVGSLDGAAQVIASLHRGEKRLIFCDSRSNVERLAAGLRDRGVDTYVSHSSISRDERRQAEQAFGQGQDCVIVATSTLELGIDVGDLDRVIQIDAPVSVASFLQRMGRTGRRAGTTPNTLFLTTKPEYLLRALGLAQLWQKGFVEDVDPPAIPHHIVAQQLLALALQEGRVGKSSWYDWIERAGLAGRGDANAIAAYMTDRGMLEVDQDMLFIGEAAEKAFGRRHFMELLSVFTSPPLVEVRHGRESLGSVHESSFYAREDSGPVLLLAGRSWALEEIDWKRRLAYVVPAPERGDSRWLGSGQPVSFELCRAMREVVCGAEAPVTLSRRAKGALAQLRDEFSWARTDATTIVSEGGRSRWWTFAGTLANLALEWRLGELAGTSGGVDELSVPLRTSATADSVPTIFDQPTKRPPDVNKEALEGLKFSQCLRADRAEAILMARACANATVRELSRERVTVQKLS